MALAVCSFDAPASDVPLVCFCSIDRSAPAMKAGLAEVTTTPLTLGSAIAASAAATYSLMLSSDSTFMDRPGMSQVSVTMPSASFSTRMLVMTATPAKPIRRAR